MAKTKGVTITVDGAPVFVAQDTFIDDLTDAEYTELLRSCDAEEHKLGLCPLCVANDVQTFGTSERESKDYVSDLWGNWSGSTWTSSEPVRSGVDPQAAAKLHAAHKVVKSFVDTFATSKIRFDVSFDESVGTAGTDMKGHRVVISPTPATDPTLDAPQAGTILTAMAVHESSHVRYGRNTSATIQKAWAGDTLLPVALGLGNILDDVRIERRFAAEYPGFAHVFASALDYVGQAGLKRAGTWIPKLQNPTDVAVAAIRYPTFADWNGLEGERDWWRAWADKWSEYDAPRKAVDAVREAIAHAVIAASQSQQQDGPGKSNGPGQFERLEVGRAEDDGETADESPIVRSATGASLTAETTLPVCVADAIEQAAITNGADASVTGDMAQDVVNQMETLAEAPGFGLGEVLTTGELKGRSTHVQSDPLVERVARAALMRSRSGHTEIEHGHKRGRMDNASLTRSAFNDTRLFHRRRAPSPGRYLFWLLVDCSSSMANQGYSRSWSPETPIAQTISAARSLANATRTTPNVRMAVYGWTTPSYSYNLNSAVIARQWATYRAWRTGEPVQNIDQLGRVPMGGTPDAPVIAWAARAIAREADRDEQPVLVVLSDGSGHDDDEMKQAIAAARKLGVEVLGVGIGGGMTGLADKYGAGKAIDWQGSIRRTALPLGRLIGRMVTPRG